MGYSKDSDKGKSLYLKVPTFKKKIALNKSPNTAPQNPRKTRTKTQNQQTERNF